VTILNEDYQLNNGVKIPKLALGTWLLDDDAAEKAVTAALQLGYRHIDTAEAYENEKGVGRGIQQSGKARDEIFVTTKLAAELKDYESAAQAIDESLQKLGLDYIDLMIIHSPQPWKEVNQSTDRHEAGNLAAYQALRGRLPCRQAARDWRFQLQPARSAEHSGSRNSSPSRQSGSGSRHEHAI